MVSSKTIITTYDPLPLLDDPPLVVTDKCPLRKRGGGGDGGEGGRAWRRSRKKTHRFYIIFSDSSIQRLRLVGQVKYRRHSTRCAAGEVKL